MRDRRKWLITLFLYGAAAHLLLLRLIAHWDYRPPANRGFINHPLVNVGLAVLGGISVCLFFLPLVGCARDRARRRTLPLLGLGILCGISATAIAEQIFLILCGAYLTISMFSGVSLLRLGAMFVVSMIEIETYGMFTVIGSIPFGIVEGVVAAAIILLCTHTLAGISGGSHTDIG